MRGLPALLVPWGRAVRTGRTGDVSRRVYTHTRRLTRPVRPGFQPCKVCREGVSQYRVPRSEDFAMPSRRTSLALVLLATAGLHPPLAVAADPPGPANRLAKESSPYLLRHARGRVDWF